MKSVRSELLSGPFADLHGRGARSNRESRFQETVHEVDPEYLEHERAHAGAEACGAQECTAPAEPAGAEPAEDPQCSAAVRTNVVHERARSIISRNESPDIPFDRSINPYRGCEHGCVYCYARPTHAYLGLSPGLDFETRIFAKTNAAELLERELRKPGYAPAFIALGANTDPYQPIERDLRVTRSVLEVLAKFRHPVSITTKSALVLRDLDLLGAMARERLAHVSISIGTLDRKIARSLEPRASTPARRIEAIRALSQARVPAGVIVAPMIPALTDRDMESVLEAAAAAGASGAWYTVLRLPLEVRDLFVEWLEEFVPLRAGHVMSLVRQMRGGRDYRAGFGTRMKGTGNYATLLRQRFDLACRRLHLTRERAALDSTRFRVPERVEDAPAAVQQSLF